jgi:transcriptional regulator with XRE-family HTH domain
MPREPADPCLARALRQLREREGISQESTAFMAGIGVATISRIESGAANPTWTTIVRITDALGVDLSDLVEAIVAQRPG